MEQELFSFDEAAGIFGVSKSTINNWLKSGLLTGISKKGCSYVSKGSIDLFLANITNINECKAKIEEYKSVLKGKEVELQEAISNKDAETLYQANSNRIEKIFERVLRNLLESAFTNGKIPEREYELLYEYLTKDSMEEAIEKFGLTREHCRQLLQKGARRLASSGQELETYDSLSEINHQLSKENSLLKSKMERYGPTLEEAELKREERRAILKILLSDSNLRKSTQISLIKGKITTIDELTDYSEIELLTFYRLDKSVLEEIHTFLAQYNMRLMDGILKPSRGGIEPCYTCLHAIDPTTGKEARENSPCLCKYGNQMVKSKDKRYCHNGKKS